MQLRLVNMLGQTVYQRNVGNVSYYNGNIAVNNLPNGMYLLELVTPNGTAVKEMDVQR